MKMRYYTKLLSIGCSKSFAREACEIADRYPNKYKFNHNATHDLLELVDWAEHALGRGRESSKAIKAVH